MGRQKVRISDKENNMVQDQPSFYHSTEFESNREEFMRAAVAFAESRAADVAAIPELVEFWALRINKNYDDEKRPGQSFYITFTLSDCPRHLEVIKQLIQRYENQGWSHRLFYSQDGWTLFLVDDKSFQMVEATEL